MARRALGPATLTVVQAVRTALTERDTSLLVACSGGADSLALAFAVRQAAVAGKLGYAAMIVNHGMQPDSSQVADRARSQLRALGYTDIVIAAVTVDPSPSGPEAGARVARYQALDAEAHSRRATVLLGHTLDDQAETVLLGLARGSGNRSLAGMVPRSGHLLRPLLEVRRQVTERACAEVGLEPWRDPHNADRRYARVRVREVVLPTLETELGPGIAEALARTAELARDDADLLDRLAAERFDGKDTLDCGALGAQPPALRRRIIRLWLIGHGLGDLSLQHITSVEQLVTQWRGQQRVELPGGSVSRVSGHLHLS
jgi:tRNA(Ile)-lysidine synthase